MTSRYRHRRTPLTATPFPSPIEPGEIVVNTANRQIAVGDAAAGTLGQPKPLIGVRFFDPTASYVLNDVVTQTGKVYRANGSIAPGAFNASNWTEIGAGGFASGVASDPVGNVAATNVQAAIAELDAEKVKKNGDVMTGHLTLPASPAADQAVRKDYVDAADAGLQADVNAKADTSYVDAQDAALQIYVDSKVVAPATVAPVMDGAATVGVTTKYAREDHVHPTDTSRAADAVVVKTSTQSLTAAQQIQARQNIYAAPFDALAYNGMQINGGMEVSQELGTAGTSINGAYPVDNWKLLITSAAVVGASPFGIAWVPGFPKWLVISTATALASPAAGDVVLIRQNIEGYRTARLAWGTASAQPITLAFWSMHHRTGVYSVAIKNSDNSRSYVATYNHAAADVPQYNTITIPGDVSGTWNVDNTAGISIRFCLACGSTLTAPAANTWYGASYEAAPGQVNGVATTAEQFRITGLIVLPGNEAPSAARSPFVMRPYDQELTLCKRSLRLIIPEGVGIAATAGTAYFTVRHEGMRAAPTVGATGPLTISNITTANYTQSTAHAAAFQNTSDWGNYYFNNFTGLASGGGHEFRASTPAAYVQLDARL